MAVDAYMVFRGYPTNPLAVGPSGSVKAESQVGSLGAHSPLLNDANFPGPSFLTTTPGAPGFVFEVEDYSFDIEQTLNIGSQSTGAGAGRVTFNPFSITRKIDTLSPNLFQMACSGTPFQWVHLALRKSSGGDTAGEIFVRFDFKLVAVKTISWAHDDESPKETVTFEYGGLQVHYTQQNANGSFVAAIPGGWNRVKNVQDTGATPL